MKKVLLCCAHSMFYDNNTGITIRSFMSLFPDNMVGELFFMEKQDPIVEKPKDFFSLRIKIPPSNTCKQFFSFRKALKDKRIISKIKEFHPDCLYLIAGYFAFNSFVLSLSKKLNVPIMIHHFDNIRESYGKKIAILIHNKNLRAIEKKAVARFVIGEQMGEYYFDKYGFNYDVLMNTVEDKNIDFPNCDKTAIKNIVYTGGLHLERAESLVLVEKAIKKMKNSHIRLLIYSNDYSTYKDMFDPSVTMFRPFVSHKDIFDVYADAYILLHVESFKDDNVFYKYSISTKISEYMISKRPIICFAPKELAIVSFLNNYHVGLTASTEEDLSNSISSLLSSTKDYCRYANEAFDYAKKHFSKEYAKALFLKYGFEL